MTLLQTIKADSLVSRKARRTLEAVALLTLVGELETAAKNTGHEATDEEVIAAIKKTIKNLDETIRVASAHGNHEIAERFSNEVKIFQRYLPKQLSSEELDSVIDTIISAGQTSVGDVMKTLKATHAGMFDGATASKIIKTKLTK